MANLLTRKVMDNMSRQYRKENGINSSTSSQNASTGNINDVEETVLLSLIKRNEKSVNHKSSKTFSTITLDELANKHSK